MDTQHSIILSLGIAISLWFLVFRGRLVAHLVDLKWKTGPLTRDEVGSLLMTRGYPNLMILWFCHHCQSFWTSLLAAVILATLSLPQGNVYAMVWAAAYLPVVFLIIRIMVLAETAGEGLVEDDAPAQDPQVSAPDTSLAVRAPSDELTATDRLVLKFFGKGPCWFEGCEDLRRQYDSDVEKAGGVDCPSCTKGDIMRVYMGHVCKALGIEEELPLLRRRREKIEKMELEGPRALAGQQSKLANHT